jgi:hypothetical protein
MSAIMVRIAGVACALSLILTALSAVLLVLNRSHPNPFPFSYWLPNIVTALLFSTVGTLIASRRSENVIGWIFCAMGFGGAIAALGGQYAVYALMTSPGTFPFGAGAAWVASLALNVVWDTNFTLLLPLFPTGRVLSRRWLPMIWIAAGVIIVSTIANAICPGPLTDPFQFAVNPFGIGRPTVVADIAQALVAVLGPVPLLLGLISVVSLVLRFRRSHGVERQQIKWFVFSVATFFLVYVPIISLLPSVVDSGLWNDIVDASVIVIFLCTGIPASVGIAILRYRLYEIDRLINRTLVYTSLTASLALVYLGLVIGLGGLMRTTTDASSNFVVVVSTLAVAGLFQPLRGRIQTIVDRRFYRHKYDATRTLEAFSARLRDEIDLDTLTAALRATVMDTMQPESVSIWLRKTARRSDRRNDSVTIGT